MTNSLREPKNRHMIEYSRGWCGTCDDLAKPNSNKLLYQMTDCSYDYLD